MDCLSIRSQLFLWYTPVELTYLEGDELIKFMNFSKPTYEMLGLLNDLELGLYIEKRFASYQKSN